MEILQVIGLIFLGVYVGGRFGNEWQQDTGLRQKGVYLKLFEILILKYRWKPQSFIFN